MEGLCTDRTLIPPMSGNTKTLRTGLVMPLLEGEKVGAGQGDEAQRLWKRQKLWKRRQRN